MGGCREPHGQGGKSHCGPRTILEYGGPIKLDHDLIRVFVFLHVAHIAQVLGLHQQSMFAIAEGGLKWEDTVAAGVRRCRQLLHWHSHPQTNEESEVKEEKWRRGG